MNEAEKEKARQKILRYQTNPVEYFTEVLNVTLEYYQAAAVQTIADNSRIAIAACHDLGKSFIMSRIVLWFLPCFPGSKIITTAPTFNQVKNILWSEIRAGYGKSRAPLGGKMLQTEWHCGADHFAIGFTSRNESVGDSGQSKLSTFQGFHAPYILVIFDEATGIPPNIWNMAEGLLTSANVKFIAIGNPTSRNSEFFRCFRDPSWAKIYLSCFDSPNLVANGIVNDNTLQNEIDLLRSMNDFDAQARLKSYHVVKEYLLSTQWVMGRALKWGVSHPLFISKVLGKFPEEGENTLMPLGVIEDAQLRIAYPEDSDRKTIGVDVARFGTDSTVITVLHGQKFITKKVLIKCDTMVVAGEITALAKEYRVDIIVIDETGIGSGVVDAINQNRQQKILPYNIEVRGVQFGAACDHEEDKAKYVNIKARMFDLLAQDLKRGLTLPPDDIYLEELPTILYAYDSKGRMVIESKDDYKKRTGRGSPDHADSLALANYGRYDESRIGSFSRMSNDAPAPQAAAFQGDTW